MVLNLRLAANSPTPVNLNPAEGPGSAAPGSGQSGLSAQNDRARIPGDLPKYRDMLARSPNPAAAQFAALLANLDAGLSKQEMSAKDHSARCEQIAQAANMLNGSAPVDEAVLAGLNLSGMTPQANRLTPQEHAIIHTDLAVQFDPELGIAVTGRQTSLTAARENKQRGRLDFLISRQAAITAAPAGLQTGESKKLGGIASCPVETIEPAPQAIPKQGRPIGLNKLRAPSPVDMSRIAQRTADGGPRPVGAVNAEVQAVRIGRGAPVKVGDSRPIGAANATGVRRTGFALKLNGDRTSRSIGAGFVDIPRHLQTVVEPAPPSAETTPTAEDTARVAATP